MWDREVVDAAGILIFCHGEGAVRYAQKKTEEQLEIGHLEGVTHWRRIAEAIEFIQTDERQ